MKEFREVVKIRKIPATYQFRCYLCDFEITDYDWHLGLIKMNEHVMLNHSSEVESLDMEDLYSRKPKIALDYY